MMLICAVSEDVAEHSDGVAEAANVRVKPEPTAAFIGEAVKAVQHLPQANSIEHDDSHDEHSGMYTVPLTF
jgi:hypothetical protein